LDNIYLLNGYDIEEHDGERYVFVRHMDELHVAIGRHIVTKRKGLTGQEIRFLRNTLNLTQSELAKELGNNPQSIVRWEKGQVALPGPAEKLLRVFFFAKLLTEEDLRDLILQTLGELDDIDESTTMPAKFILNDHWTENVPHMACC
jgi:DNA-binding transcriptional regulator YiaG